MASVTTSAHPPGPMPAPAAAWAKVRAMGDIQFTPLAPVPEPVRQQSPWLRAVIDWLAKVLGPFGQWLALHWHAIEIGGAVVVLLVVGWVIWASLRGRQRKSRKSADEAPWAPNAAMARVLLADADRLAADGRFDEAVHLLLRRSFDDIALARPGWLSPASTAREVSQASALPAAARQAFGRIADEVERSRYALRPLAGPDWTRARAAYAAFAVPARGDA